MNEEIYADITARLDALGEQLGVASGQVWEILVRQQAVESVSNFAWGLVYMVLLGLVWFFGSRIIAYSKVVEAKLRDEGASEYKIDEEAKGFALFGWGTRVVGTTAFGIYFITDVSTGIKLLINPEYYALKEILKVVGG